MRILKHFSIAALVFSFMSAAFAADPPMPYPGGMEQKCEPSRKQYYQDRYDLCMKTDNRGSGYCQQWAGCPQLLKTGPVSAIDSCGGESRRSYYQSRYDSCMKTDSRGASYCREWSGCPAIFSATPSQAPVPPQPPAPVCEASRQSYYQSRYDSCMQTDSRGSQYCQQWAGCPQLLKTAPVSAIDSCGGESRRAYYQSRLDSCLKTDSRGYNYCKEWSGCPAIFPATAP